MISYTYDNVGNRLTRTDSVEGTTSYTYDDNDRLLTETLVKDGETVHTISYTYDDNGNLISRTQVADGISQTTTYTWNDDDRLVAVNTPDGTVITYEYDDEGIRVSSTVNGETTEYLIDKNQPYAQVLEEFKSGDLEAFYIYGHDLISQTRDGEQDTYHVDGLGSTRTLTDEEGNVTDTYDYDAFGELIDSEGNSENSYLFAGEQFDKDLEDYYLRQRFYDPGSGRFLRRDTYEGRLNEPITLHKYLYGNANPVSYIDPTGLYSLGEHQAAVSIANTLAGIQAESGTYLISATLNGGNSGIEDVLLDIGITLAVTVAPFAIPYVAKGVSSGLSALQRRIDARALANSVEELRLTNTVAAHSSDFTRKSAIDGGLFTELDRPFINSPLLYQEIMKAKVPVPDPRGVPGALRWDVEGSFRGRQGTWELVVDSKTKTVLHFNFVGKRK